MRRLPALIGKTSWPLAFAQRAFCAAEIRARAAADIFRRGLDDPVLYVPAKAASAAFRSIQLSRNLVPLSLYQRDCVHVFRLRAMIVQEIRQMRSGRIVFPRLTSYRLPVTLSRSTVVLNA